MVGFYYILRHEVDFVTSSRTNLANITLGEVMLGRGLCNSESLTPGPSPGGDGGFGGSWKSVEVAEDGLLSGGELGEGL